jgi:phosphoglycolate phosphatase-like HAD superfamily hydrolase
LLCCAELGLPPSRCIYVGDAPTDGRAAGGGGVVGVGVSYGSHSASSLAPHFATVVGSVDELGAALADALRAPT